MNIHRHWLMFVILVLLVVLAACDNDNNEDNDDDNIETETEVPSTQEVAEAETTQTFSQSNDLGLTISFDYPADWVVQNTDALGIVVTNNPANLDTALETLGTDNTIADDTAVVILQAFPEQNPNLDDLDTFLNTDDANATIERVTIAGRDASQTSTSDTRNTVIAFENAVVLSVVATSPDDFSTFAEATNAILESLQIEAMVIEDAEDTSAFSENIDGVNLSLTIPDGWVAVDVLPQVIVANSVEAANTLLEVFGTEEPIPASSAGVILEIIPLAGETLDDFETEAMEDEVFSNIERTTVAGQEALSYSLEAGGNRYDFYVIVFGENAVFANLGAPADEFASYEISFTALLEGLSVEAASEDNEG